MPDINDPKPDTNTPNNSPSTQPKKSKVVNDIISKGRTMTGKKPDQIEFNPVLEEKEKTAVFAYGRFNPPTTGHEKLIHKVEETAKSHNADAHIIASHSEGSGKNPLPKDKKVDYLKKVASPSTKVSSSDKEHPSFLQQAKKLHDAGYHHLVMVAGSDRVDEYHKKLHQYNGKEGHYNFKSIKVVSAGHRDPDAEGTEGMSGTKMREHARSGNMKAFKSGLPKALHPHAEEIANHIRSVKEDVDDVFDMFILETAVSEIGQIYDQVIAEAYDEDKENAKIKSVNHTNTHDRDDGKSERTLLYKNDTPGEPKSSKVKEDLNLAFEAWVNDENPDPKHREVVNRHGQDRKKIQLVPRDKKDRKEDDRPYRHQEIQKKIIDEKYGKRYKPKSILSAMEIIKPGAEKRMDAAVAGLKQNAADYQKILDKEKKKTNESVNSAGGGSVRGMGHSSGNPDGESGSYLGQNIADADTRDNIIKAHINQHFSLHMNDTKKVAKEETIKEDLRQWFKDKWVRMDTKGNIKGDCAREEGEGKPKCLPIAKARAMDKEDRAAAARRKRREDPVADRPGKGGAPINVRTEAANPAQQAAIAIALIKAGKKKGKDPGPQKEEFQVEEYLEEKNKPTNPALWSRAKALARSKFDVYPSAYANGWAAKWYKSKGGGWKSVSEEVDRDPISQLEDKLNTATDKSYDGIDKIMRGIAKEHNIDVHDLHDMWVKKTGITPDQYVKESLLDFRKRYIGQRKPLKPETLAILDKVAKGEPIKQEKPKKQETKEETINELSNELIGKVNKIRTLTGIKSKTPTASDTLNKAVEKVRSRTEVGKVK